MIPPPGAAGPTPPCAEADPAATAAAAGTAAGSLVACARPPCAAVVVHYRGLDDTMACLLSLRAHAPAVPVVVVDNDAPDGSGRALAARLRDDADVAVVRAPRNLGFGGGRNLGIERALAAWPDLAHVLLLNPDAELTAGALDAMRATAARHPDAGVVGARILRRDGAVWFEQGRFPRFTLSGFHRRPRGRGRGHDVDAPANGADVATPFVTGCCMLLDAGLLRAGLRFHEPFFLYGEDADLCCEVRARGRSLWIASAATVVHDGSGSQRGDRVLDGWTRDQVFWLQRAKAMLARRRLRLHERLVFWLVALLGKPLAALATGRGVRWLPAYLRGLWAGATANVAKPGAAATAPPRVS